MKLNTSKEVWIARMSAWVLLCLLSSGVLFVTTFVVRPALFVAPNLTDKIAVALYCPGAERTSQRRRDHLRQLRQTPPAHAVTPSKSPVTSRMAAPTPSKTASMPSHPLEACLASAV